MYSDIIFLFLFPFLNTSAENMGFAVKNVDEYGGHVEFGSGEEMACIIGHLDVVPAGAGWDNGAFNPTVLNGRLYGRGAIDDKGAHGGGSVCYEGVKGHGV